MSNEDDLLVPRVAHLGLLPGLLATGRGAGGGGRPLRGRGGARGQGRRTDLLTHHHWRHVLSRAQAQGSQGNTTEQNREFYYILMACLS
jgi:hypothetical protein